MAQLLERRPVTAEVAVRVPLGSFWKFSSAGRHHLPYNRGSQVRALYLRIGTGKPVPVMLNVAELADAQDLKSCCSDTVPVRFRSPAFIERALDKSVIIDEKKLIEYVCVAQLDRALGYGPRCREFESSRARI